MAEAAMQGAHLLFWSNLGFSIVQFKDTLTCSWGSWGIKPATFLENPLYLPSHSPPNCMTPCKWDANCKAIYLLMLPHETHRPHRGCWTVGHNSWASRVKGRDTVWGSNQRLKSFFSESYVSIIWMQGHDAYICRIQCDFPKDIIISV